MIDGKTEAFETGEIQIVKNGVSGIPVFQMCRIAAKALEDSAEIVISRGGGDEIIV